MKQPVFQASHLSYAYNASSVLHDLSFSIDTGQRIAILGANGSGKSTLLKLLNALIFPTSGHLYFYKKEVTQKLFKQETEEFSFRRQVGFVFQDPDVQLFNQTVWDEVIFGPLHLGLSPSEVIERGNRAMDILSITRLRDRSPFMLSGGEKKRVAMASVLSIQPSVWLLDEPMASLDPRTQSRLLDFIDDVHQKGDTIIMTTHDLTLLSEMSDRVLVMSEDHRLVADSSPQKLLRRTDFLERHNLVHNHVHKHDGRRHRHRHTHKA